MALVLLGGVLAYAVVAADRLVDLVAGVGAVGCAVAAVALAGRWPSVLPLGLAGVGSAYAVCLGFRSGGADARAPFVAAALFAAAELAYWSLEPVRPQGGVRLVGRRITLLVAAALATALVGSLLLVAAAGTSGGVALEAVGVAAAVAALAVIAVLVTRPRPEL